MRYQRGSWMSQEEDFMDFHMDLYTDEPWHYHQLLNNMLLAKEALICRSMNFKRPWKVCCGVYLSNRSYKSCKSQGGASNESVLFAQLIPQMLNWIEIKGIWRPSQHLDLKCEGVLGLEQYLAKLYALK